MGVPKVTDDYLGTAKVMCGYQVSNSTHLSIYCEAFLLIYTYHCYFTCYVGCQLLPINVERVSGSQYETGSLDGSIRGIFAVTEDQSV